MSLTTNHASTLAKCMGLHRPRLSLAAWRRQGKGSSSDDDNDKRNVKDFMEGSSVSPRWRWPAWSIDAEEEDSRRSSSKRAPTPPPPPPPPVSFKDSPFDFWQRPRAEPSNRPRPQKKEQGDWNFGDFSFREKESGMNALASRLYRNKEIRGLAEQEALRKAEAEREDSNLASASRSRPGPPEEFESDRQFYEWMEKKREARTREREERQEDEIWGIARVYLMVAVVIILIALATTLA